MKKLLLILTLAVSSAFGQSAADYNTVTTVVTPAALVASAWSTNAAVDVSPFTGRLLFVFSTPAVGATNFVIQSGVTTTGAWNTVANVTCTGPTNITASVDSRANSRYYRVIVVNWTNANTASGVLIAKPKRL
jgi:hypothetical protein